MKMTMTPAKLAANRANGQKSRGPRTDAGKQISARNARSTHGFCSRNPQLSPEDEAAIDRIYAIFQGEYHPATAEEIATVREAAVSKWHRDRVSRILDQALALHNPVDSARALSGLYRHTAAAENRFFRSVAALSNLNSSRTETNEIAPANPASHPDPTHDLRERTHHVPVKSTNMPKLISQPTRIEAAGNKPKLIDEYIGRVNSGTSSLSVAHLRSPGGWVEPGQTPAFEEFTVVLKGTLRVEYTGGIMDVHAGQAVVTSPGEWVRYSTPQPDGAEYIAVCLPAFSMQTVNRDPD
jgi:mannose-6-phosphate isomerase-like protein (cupin superfamily)